MADQPNAVASAAPGAETTAKTTAAPAKKGGKALSCNVKCGGVFYNAGDKIAKNHPNYEELKEFLV